MNVAKRMKQLRALLDVRTGPGAAILPKDVKKIHLQFARKINDGHFGARKVWRTYLPRLKYHNPAVSMTVNREVEQTGPATLSIHFTAVPRSASAIASAASSSSSDPSTTPSDHNPSKRVETIDMKHKHESEILSKLLEMTKAKPYEISEEEQIELEEAESFTRNSQRDREAQARLNEVKWQEQALLDQARGAGTEAS